MKRRELREEWKDEFPAFKAGRLNFLCTTVYQGRSRKELWMTRIYSRAGEQWDCSVSSLLCVVLMDGGAGTRFQTGANLQLSRARAAGTQGIYIQAVCVSKGGRGVGDQNILIKPETETTLCPRVCGDIPEFKFESFNLSFCRGETWSSLLVGCFFFLTLEGSKPQRMKKSLIFVILDFCTKLETACQKGFTAKCGWTVWTRPHEDD